MRQDRLPHGQDRPAEGLHLLSQRLLPLRRMWLQAHAKDVLQQPALQYGQGGVLQHTCTQDRGRHGQPGRAGDQGGPQRSQNLPICQRTDPTRRQESVRLGGPGHQGPHQEPADPGGRAAGGNDERRADDGRERQQRALRGEVPELGPLRLLRPPHPARAQADGRTEKVLQAPRPGHQLIPGKHEVFLLHY